jgi:tetratricopeptide (TPR) repeat protein
MRIGFALGMRLPAWAVVGVPASCLLVSLLLAPALAHDSNQGEIETITSEIGAVGGTATDYLRRGELHRLSGEWNAAQADYDRAARLDPSLTQVHLCGAALFLAMGRPAEAKRTLDRVLAHEPRHADALHLRAQVQLALGRPLDAVRDLDRTLVCIKRPTPDHYLERARTLAACGDRYLDRELKGIDEGIERFGPIVSLEFFAIDLELKRRNFDAALDRLERLVPQLGPSGILLERRGEILAAAGRGDEARAAFTAALAEIESLPPQRRSSQSVLEREGRLRAAVAGERVPFLEPASHQGAAPGSARR